MGDNSKDIFWTRAFNYGCSFWSLFNLCHRHNGVNRQILQKCEDFGQSNSDEKPSDYENIHILPLPNGSSSFVSAPFNVLTEQPNSSLNHFGHAHDIDLMAIQKNNLCMSNVIKPQSPSALCKLKNSDSSQGLPELVTLDMLTSKDEVDDEIKNGKYFMELLRLQQLDLEKHCVQVKSYLDDIAKNECYGEAEGLMRSAVGKANLLVERRFNHFRKLCESNIDSNLIPQSATNDDLMGYWDIVQIQVGEVKKMFDQIEQAKANNWQCRNNVQDSMHRHRIQKVQGSQILKRVHTPSKSRDEARKKLSEIREEGRLKIKRNEFNPTMIYCSNRTSK